MSGESENPENEVALPWGHPEAVAARAEYQAEIDARIAELNAGYERPSSAADDQARTDHANKVIDDHMRNLTRTWPQAAVASPQTRGGGRRVLYRDEQTPGPAHFDDDGFWSMSNWPGVPKADLEMARKLWEAGAADRDPKEG